MELLALAVLDRRVPDEEVAPYWWRVEGEDVFDRLITELWPEE